MKLYKKMICVVVSLMTVFIVLGTTSIESKAEVKTRYIGEWLFKPSSKYYKQKFIASRQRGWLQLDQYNSTNENVVKIYSPSLNFFSSCEGSYEVRAVGPGKATLVHYEKIDDVWNKVSEDHYYVKKYQNPFALVKVGNINITRYFDKTNTPGYWDSSKFKRIEGKKKITVKLKPQYKFAKGEKAKRTVNITKAGGIFFKVVDRKQPKYVFNLHYISLID